MEIHKMLCLSTAHLHPNTRLTLSATQDTLICYPKRDYGWFVYVPDRAEVPADNLDLSADLKNCLGFAQELGAGWIMFDGDGPIEDGLAVYDEALALQADEAHECLAA